MVYPARAAPAAAAAGEQATPPQEGQRAMPTPFLTKTYQLVDDPVIDDVISWNEDGSTFVVWRPAEFARDVLPTYFKHNNFSSFVRQLNTYGFRKIVPDRWEFANECFRRGEKRLLCDIRRRKISPTPTPPAVLATDPANRVGSPSNSGDDQVLSTNSSSAGPGSSGGASEQAEENEWLRQENKRLSRELGQMKSLCNDILQLMSKYALCRKNGAAADGGEGALTSPSPELVLRRSSPEEEEAGEGSSGRREGPRLFGVSIGFKRNRGEDGEAAPDVKPEPMDGAKEP